MTNTNCRWIILFIMLNLVFMFFFPKIAYSNTNWINYFRKDSMVNRYKRAYAVFDDMLWVGTFGRGIKVIAGDQKITYTNRNTRSNQRTDDGLIVDYIMSLAIDEKTKRVWVGTNQGLASCDLDGTNWKRFTSERDGLPSNVIRDIKIDSDDNVWIATPSGVGKFDGVRWKTYDQSSGIIQSSVRTINVQGNSVWVGTIGGAISRYQNGNWQTYMSF